MQAAAGEAEGGDPDRAGIRAATNAAVPSIPSTYLAHDGELELVGRGLVDLGPSSYLSARLLTWGESGQLTGFDPQAVTFHEGIYSTTLITHITRLL